MFKNIFLIVLMCCFLQIGNSQNVLIQIKNQEKEKINYHFVDENKEVKIKLPEGHIPMNSFQFPIQRYEDGLCLIHAKNSFYFINTQGKKVITFDDITTNYHVFPFSEGLAVVRIFNSDFPSGQRDHYIDIHGKKVFDQYFYKANSFSEKFALVELLDENGKAKTGNKRWAYIKNSGKIAITFQDEAKEIVRLTPFQEGIATVIFKDAFYYINRVGKNILDIPLEENIKRVGSQFSEKIARRRIPKTEKNQQGNNFSFYNYNGEELFQIKNYNRVTSFNEGLCWVTQLDKENSSKNKRVFKQYFLNKKGEVALEYTEGRIASNFKWGLAKVKKETKSGYLTGFIDPYGNEIIEAKYQKAYRVSPQYIYAEIDNENYEIIDLYGLGIPTFKNNIILDKKEDEEIKKDNKPQLKIRP